MQTHVAPTLALAFLLAATSGITPGLAATPTPDPLSTTAERTGWTRTGRYDEAVTLCARFQKTFPRQARCVRFGTTPEGRPMVALVASADGTLTAKQARARSRPVVLAQGSIHAGECDGKDAGFFVIRELLRGKRPGPLRHATFVFVPVFNIDGHERFGAHNRPNQVGPEEMGWRVTSHNLNLNRDYAKAEAPEMGAMLSLLNEWDPIVYADLHVTDGADFRHQVGLVTHPSHGAPAKLIEQAQLFAARVAERIKPRMPLLFYPEFKTEDDPASGFEAGVSPPRFSQAYWGVRNRVGILVETHSWKDYATRVRATIEILDGILAHAAKHGAAMLAAARQADEEGARLAGQPVPLAFEATERSREVEFQGYAYARAQSPVSGRLMTVYDPTKPVTYKLPLFDELKPKTTVTAPAKGYLVPPPHAEWLAKKLRLHGISYERVQPGLQRQVEAFRARGEPEFAPQSFENRQTLAIQGEWKPEPRDIPQGTILVPIAQPKARLVLHLLEPLSKDSYLSWGFFNAHFERKEYMEPYVAERVARDLMAKDPALKAAFERRLRDDPEFARSAEKRLEFFHRRHASWDERFGLYPVYRL